MGVQVPPRAFLMRLTFFQAEGTEKMCSRINFELIEYEREILLRHLGYISSMPAKNKEYPIQLLFCRRGGRVVECAGLENRCPRKRTVSSNLTLSVVLLIPRNHWTRIGDGFAEHTGKGQRIPAKHRLSRNIVNNIPYRKKRTPTRLRSSRSSWPK